MKKAINIKAVATVFMLVIALAALGLVLGIMFTDNVAEAETGAENGAVTAAEDGQEGSADETAEQPADDNKAMIAIAAAVAIGVVAAAGAIAMGITISKSNESIARQPEAKNDIRSSMMLGLVFIETAIIYALIVAILIIFVL